MRSPARLEWEKANRTLAEALAQDPSRTPLSVIRTSYYAMFHAALAAILINTVSPPKKHDSVKRQFGDLVKDRGVAFRDAASALSSMLKQRIKADYEADPSLTEEQARAAVITAQAFLDLCSREFGFPRSAEPPDA